MLPQVSGCGRYSKSGTGGSVNRDRTVQKERCRAGGDIPSVIPGDVTCCAGGGRRSQQQQTMQWP
jgi:hypothetical protein